jgi:hypothetical protein
MFNSTLRTLLISFIFLLMFSQTSPAQTTAFTYQGKLADNGNPANGSYDLQFKLFDTATVGTGVQQGTTVTVSNVTVSNGIFTVPLDFGACASCFNGAARFLEIAVRPTGGSFTTLTPRQPITSTPYALKSQNATTADGLSVVCTNCVTSSQIQSVNGSAVTGTIPVASVPAGSPNYIQNTTSQQAASNFNISGMGTANIVSATTQFNLGGARVLSAPGMNNLFVGFNTGTTGNDNAFFGNSAGSANTSGHHNAFFGSQAGLVNTTGLFNAFFGAAAGQANTSGNFNAFFGEVAGSANTTGHDNAFFGRAAGDSNNSGFQNSFFGSSAAFNNTTGNNNTFFGYFAGLSNQTGNNNTFIGANADVGNTNLTNATAIGFRALVEQDNALVLGSINGKNSATADTLVGIGTTTPDALLDVQRDSLTIPEVARFTSYGNTANDILGRSSNGTRFAPTATPSGRPLLQLGATGHDGTDFATTARASIQLIASEDWTSTAQGTNIRFLTTANGTVTTSTRVFIRDDGNVGIGTTAPLDKLDVNGDIRVGTGTTGCVKDSNGTVIAGSCSSDARLKRNIVPFAHLLDKLVQLQPVQFYWRADEFKERHFGTKPSFGLIAQEVEKVLPELVTEDEQGYKAVNYSKLPLLTLQAVKELKQENGALKQRVEEQQTQLRAQQKQVDSLKKLVCLDHPEAEMCKP